MKETLLLFVTLVAFVSTEPSLIDTPLDCGGLHSPLIEGCHRFPRSADSAPQGSIVFKGQKPLSGPERRPSYNVDYQRKIWEGKNGHISTTSGAQKLPGQRWERTIGLQGTWRFRRAAKSRGKISVKASKPMSGRNRRPTYNVKYQQNVVKGKKGGVSVSGNIQKRPGQRVDSNVGVEGTWNPNPKSKITFEGNKPITGPDRRPSYNVNYQQNIWKGKNGEVNIGAGAQKLPGQRVEPNVGIQGTLRFRRSPDPKKKKKGRVSVEVNKPMSGPERRPSYNVDYQREVWKGKNGKVNVGGSAQKRPGQRWKSNVGVKGSWRFRRSPDPKKKKKSSVTVEANKPMSGPERRPSYNVDYQREIWKGKNGDVSVGGGAQKRPGQRWESNVGVKGTWRFRRSPDPKKKKKSSVTVEANKPMSGPERRPSYNVDYQREIWKGKNGDVSVGGGAQKRPGRRWESNVGVKGTWRFRRSPDPKKKKKSSVTVEANKPMSGPERRPSYNVDYQREIWKGKNGDVSVGGGAQKRPGQRWESNVGVKGTWRFRRSPDPKKKKKSSVTVEANKPMSGPERRPSYNVDYQREIWKGKNGDVSVGGGAQKRPGQRWESNVGVKGTWRFRRSPDPKKKKKSSVTVEANKPMSGPERRPSYNVDYQREIWKGKNGDVSVGGGAQKRPGQRWESNVGVKGTWRFRRSPDPEKKKASSATEEVKKPRSGPEPHLSYDVNHLQEFWNRKNEVSVAGGARTQFAQQWDPKFWGTWRLRRSPDPKKKKKGRVSVEVNKPISGPERRPSYNVDYQQEVWKGKNGKVNVGGSAQKRPGQRWKSNVGVKGSWRFRRSADPQREIIIDAKNRIKERNRCPPANANYQKPLGTNTAGKKSVGINGAKVPLYVGFPLTFRW